MYKNIGNNFHFFISNDFLKTHSFSIISIHKIINKNSISQPTIICSITRCTYFFHNWQVTYIISAGYFIVVFGDKIHGFKIRQKCTDRKKQKFEIISQFDRDRYQECVYKIRKNKQNKLTQC